MSFFNTVSYIWCGKVQLNYVLTAIFYTFVFDVYRYLNFIVFVFIYFLTAWSGLTFDERPFEIRIAVAVAEGVYYALVIPAVVVPKTVDILKRTGFVIAVTKIDALFILDVVVARF